MIRCGQRDLGLVPSWSAGPGPNWSRLCWSKEATGGWRKMSELRVPQLARLPLVCRYAIESSSSGETACISQACKRPILINSENAH